EQEQVVDRQALLEQVGGEELLARLAPELQHDEQVECERDRDPDGAPDDRGAPGLGRVPAVRDQIDRYEYDQQGTEQGPRPDRHVDDGHDDSTCEALTISGSVERGYAWRAEHEPWMLVQHRVRGRERCGDV